MPSKTRLILIGGPSHVGKSTLTQALTSHLRGSYCSTDKLARRPGRPWRDGLKEIPKHVADHYLSLSVDELIEDVLLHYRKNVWPLVEKLIAQYTTDSSPETFIIEGSALLPDLVAMLDSDNLSSCWLVASHDFLTRRIYASSQYEKKSSYEKKLVDKFLERNRILNNRIVDAVNQLGLVSFNVGEASTMTELINTCLQPR